MICMCISIYTCIYNTTTKHHNDSNKGNANSEKKNRNNNNNNAYAYIVNIFGVATTDITAFIKI